jgi:hypothetical protein
MVNKLEAVERFQKFDTAGKRKGDDGDDDSSEPSMLPTLNRQTETTYVQTLMGELPRQLTHLSNTSESTGAILGSREQPQGKLYFLTCIFRQLMGMVKQVRVRKVCLPLPVGQSRYDLQTVYLTGRSAYT